MIRLEPQSSGETRDSRELRVFRHGFCSAGVGELRSEITSPLAIASSIAMVASETSISSSNGMGEQLPWRMASRVSSISRSWPLLRRDLLRRVFPSRASSKVQKSLMRPTLPSQNTSNCSLGIDLSPFAR